MGTESKPLTIVRARLSPVGEGLQVLVYASDRPDLFARICGYFDRAGFSILDAKIHTTRNGYALDTFQIVSAIETEHYREFIHMVEADMPKAILAVAAVVAIGFLLPNLILNGKIRDRQKSILKTMPDVMDLLTVSVEDLLLVVLASMIRPSLCAVA